MSGRRRPGPIAATSGAMAILFLLVTLRRRLDGKGKESFAKRRKQSIHGNTPLTTPQFESAQRELYVRLADGSQELLVPDSRGIVKHVLVKPTKQSTFEAHRADFTASGTSTALFTPLTAAFPGRANLVARPIAGDTTNGPNAAGQTAAQAAKKVAVNKEFLRQLRAIFKIIIPRCECISWLSFPS